MKSYADNKKFAKQNNYYHVSFRFKYLNFDKKDKIDEQTSHCIWPGPFSIEPVKNLHIWKKCERDWKNKLWRLILHVRSVEEKSMFWVTFHEKICFNCDDEIGKNLSFGEFHIENDIFIS